MCKTETLSNWGHIILGLGFYQSAVDEVQACPWRIPISSRHWQLKQSATMILPSVVIEINDFFRARSYWSHPLAARMASVLVVIILITPKLVLQVCRSPEECTIQ